MGNSVTIRTVVIVGEPHDAHASQAVGALSSAGWRPVPVSDPNLVPAALQEHPDCRVGLVSLCGREPHTIGAIQALCNERSVAWVFLVEPERLAHPEVARLIAESAYDFHTCPASQERLATVLGRAWGMVQLRSRVQAAEDHGAHEYEMVGASAPMLELFAQTRKVAATEAPVLITGESGTGKELTAVALHERSPRRNGPFVAVNCGALPPTLIQAELFGYEKGAFTGAASRRIGRIESAAGGTLFLDEIGDLPLELQAHLLRFLQQGTIERLGNPRPIAVNARVVAATNVDLEQAVAAGRFRQDLYYRLNVLRLNMPALRERGEDVLLLAKFFFDKFTAEKRPHVQGYSQKALQALVQHDWPGNVRELINRVRRAMVMSDNRLITPEDLGLASAKANGNGACKNLDEAREHAEREALAAQIKQCCGNLSAAARALGVSRVTLYRLLDKHGLRPPARSA